MDSQTLILLGSIIACIIGIATFVSGLNAKAQKDGVLEQKIEQAIKGIEEIKVEVKSTSKNYNTLALMVQAHEEQIKTLFTHTSNTDVLNDRLECLGDLTKAVQTIAQVLEKKE